MRKFQFRGMLILLFIKGSFLLIANNIQTLELKKMVSKEFAADIGASMELNNKYGKIEVKTWERPFIKIEVTVIAKSANKEKAQKKLDDITISLSKNGSVVKASTEISEEGSSWWSGWWNSDKNTEMEINYFVQMPSNIPSTIENKYGNIYLPDLKAKTSINLKYGNLEGKNIENDLLIQLAYGKATMGSTKKMSGNVSYSDFRGLKTEILNLTSKYSKVFLDDATIVTLSSKYDMYKLGTVNTMNLTGSYDDIQIGSLGNSTMVLKYSGIEIGSLSHSLKMDISYGSLMVENLKTSFKSIDINTAYAPIKIYGTVPAKINIEGKYCEAQLGADFIQTQNESRDHTTHIKGYKISEKTNATINIVSKYGEVILK